MIVYSIKYFRMYLQDTKFQVEINNNPLTHLGSMKYSHGRVVTWALALQPYQFTVSHRAGTANANANGLSRYQGSQSKDEGNVGERPRFRDTKSGNIRNQKLTYRK